MSAELWPGQPFPLGAAFDGTGTNFSVFSEIAERVELCLFDAAGRETRHELPEQTAYCWHGYHPRVGPGQRYGFRVHGPWAPREGLRCLPSKLLVDPYARALEGAVRWDQAVFGYAFGDPDGPPNTDDSAPFVPKSLVCRSEFDWGDDRPPRTPWHETVLYEAHVRGLTLRHPEVPKELRGTYAGVAHSALIEHLLALGVTALELMPVHAFVHDKFLFDRGLTNYWGYNSIGYFAPHGEYAADRGLGGAIDEFKRMVKALHAAGIEVILDVVYNHTAEGSHLGPMLAFRGLDNRAYYRLDPRDRSRYVDYTGTGNSLNMRSPYVLQLILDSLRYWVQEMHVDGFRFDLASTLARELHDVDRLSSFFDLIQQDPVVSQVKLIAEPWDVGEGGYQVGNFPPLWSEWNGKYRDCVRDFWRGVPGQVGEFAYRFTGSSDLYERSGRNPYASINFVTAHDGFTLADLVAYERKHNADNGEHNRDGTDDNRSWNCGHEGPTDDPRIRLLRQRQQRNLLTTLVLSSGVPMLLGGDEFGRTQRGNNNAYCQDNELSWFDWEHLDTELLEFVRRLVRFRRQHPVFHRRGWFGGRRIHGSDIRDIAWFFPDGRRRAHEQDWHTPENVLGVFLNGHGLAKPDLQGRRVLDDSFYLAINGEPDTLSFRLPPSAYGGGWRLLLDTHEGWIDDPATPRRHPEEELEVRGRSVQLLLKLE